jgi:acylphosphatase
VSYVAKNARDTVEIWITGKDESVKIIWQGDDEEKLKEAISNHSLAVREIAKQEEDLQRLQEIKIFN